MTINSIFATPGNAAELALESLGMRKDAHAMELMGSLPMLQMHFSGETAQTDEGLTTILQENRDPLTVAHGLIHRSGRGPTHTAVEVVRTPPLNTHAR